MSNLRQVLKKGTDGPEGDIEALIGKGPPAKATAFSAVPAPRGAGYNPVFLAKVIFRKVFELLTSSDEDDITRPGGMLTLAKDIILGILLGVMTVSTLIFLDHRNVFHFQSAHNFRNAAFQLLNDPETIANLEESSELKFMTVADHEGKHKEIDSASEKIASSNEAVEKRTKEGEEMKKEVDSIQAEYDSLRGNPLLGLDKYCGSCSWGGPTSCDKRVQYLQDTYSTRLIAAKISAMVHPSCIKG